MRAGSALLFAVFAVLLCGASSGAAGLPPPSFGRSVDIGLVSGVVTVKPAAAPSFRLGTQDRNIPVGSEIDTSHGEVDLRSAPRPGSMSRRVQDGQFAGGSFTVLERPSQLGLTVLELISAANRRRVCGSVTSGQPAAAHPSNRVLDTLHAHDDHGSFRTRGQYSAATVRGTVWDTIDRCDGTLTEVYRGTVIVDDFRLHKTIAVHAGHSYLARAR